MMLRIKTPLVLLATLLMFSCVFLPAMRGDEITFTFIFSSTGSFTAQNTGAMFGPALNILVTDNTTNKSLPLAGLATASTGVASSFIATPTLLVATYDAGAANSVLVESGSTVFVSGITEDRSNVLSTFPAGSGAFLSNFEVTSVDPAVLKMFGLGPEFLPTGSVVSTFQEANLSSSDKLTATGGGGSISIETPTVTVVPELATWALLVSGVFLLGVKKCLKQS